jgi:hypothetical protein
MSSKVVISYRRSDSPAMAGRICDQLKLRYGNASVYMDIDNVPLGIDFREHIHQALDQANVLIVVVGPKWIGDHDGQSRIAEDSDFVRAEVEVALNRNIPVVPVLVDGASMPKPAVLPDAIKSFAFRNGMAVEPGVDFHSQMDRLARALDRIIGVAERPASSRHTTWPRRALFLALPIGAVATMLVAAAFVWFRPPPAGVGGPWAPPPGRSHWVVEKSTVYLEPTGERRQFFFVEPSSELMAQGAQPGYLLFDGRKIGAAYEGKLRIFAGRCTTHDYDVSGPITNDDETVTLVGKAPRIDPDSCMKVDEQERTLVFNYKRMHR